MTTENDQPASRLEIAKAIAEQIALEQQLSATRMSWNLTFQGFMIASYALVATAERYHSVYPFIQFVIVVAGIAVSFATWVGVEASGKQRAALKAHWNDARWGIEKTGLPQPFSREEVSSQGKLPSWLICWTIILMWLGLGVLNQLIRIGLIA